MEKKRKSQDQQKGKKSAKKRLRQEVTKEGGPKVKKFNPNKFKESAGFIHYNSHEDPDQVRLSQAEIQAAVDVTSAQKHFDLALKDFGPYYINYSRNGRNLLLGGERGHYAAFDWQTKRLACEGNVMETINSVKWLQNETMFAAAQKTGVYVYDNQGMELHHLRDLDAVLRMEFLPYHMLLVTANAKGFLCYFDISVGTKVKDGGICTGLGRLDVMTQNPSNAIIMMGHAAGTVTMWTPNHKEAVVKMLCHKAPVRAIAVDKTGNYLATSGVDKRVKVFDLRTKKLLSASHVPVSASSLAFSQRGLLAAALGNTVKIFKDARRETEVVAPYLSHVCNSSIRDLQFCPHEDVLGVGHHTGFTSLIVPGSGEPNIDALEVNPHANKTQRQHAEVRMLLDKVKPEMIGLEDWSTKVLRRQTAEKQAALQKKLGKKEKEMKQRDTRRKQVTVGTPKRKKHDVDNSDPLSRFRKTSD